MKANFITIIVRIIIKLKNLYYYYYCQIRDFTILLKSVFITTIIAKDFKVAEFVITTNLITTIIKFIIVTIIKKNLYVKEFGY